MRKYSSKRRLRRCLSGKPKPQKFKTNGELRCNKMTHRGGKPGYYTQCRHSVAKNKRKYCNVHSI